MISAEDWARLEAHFETLCDRPRDEQIEALRALDLSPEHKAELASLLAFDQPTGGLESLSRAVQTLSRDLEGEDLIGQRVGAYRLTGRLGAGGMGEVLLAERADGRFEARVAIKFVATTSLRDRALFERERRVLARLDHPSIARIIDAGEDERLGAFLVMEYVDGQAIDEAVRERAAGPYRVLDWMAAAADAVAAAHQSLVLHRDLKPAHLVIAGEGDLKILDFGVAGLLDQKADDGGVTAQSSFTPRYAAPEQILNQPASTRTDVYALGLILFELLAGGRGAFGDRPAAMAERKLADDRAALPRLAGLSRARRQDLEAIVDFCLARAPDARYASPADLAQDLRAVLGDQPVQARRPGWVESGWRWCRRHRLASAALAVAVVSVVVGTSLVLRYAQQAQLDRQRALEEARKAQASTEFLADLFSGSTPGRSQGPETTARELLERGRSRMSEELADQPETRAYLELVMARSYMFLGLYDEALALIDAPVEIVASGPSSTDAAADALIVGNDRALLKARLLNFKGDYQKSLDHLARQDLDRFRPLQRARAELTRSTALVNLDDTPGARRAAEQVLRWAGLDEDGLEMRASAQNMLAVIAYNERDFEQAQGILEDLLATRIRQFGESHAETALAIHNLAGVSYALGDLDAAFDQYQRAATLFEAHFGVENRSFAMVQRALAMTQRKRGQAEDALQGFERTLGVIENWNGSDNPMWREVEMQRIDLLILIGRDDEAQAALVAFGPLDPADWEGRSSEACRWARLRAAMSLAEDVQRWCEELGPEPDHLRASQDYLRARIAANSRAADFEEHRARALDAIDLIAPPDPLLEAAIRRL
jgi:serine/threonine-protein kinase